MKDLTVSIVTHNSENDILKLLESIYKFSSDLNFKIFVIDNASKDNTVKLVKENYPEVYTVESRKNMGFGKAHNLVLGKISSDFHLIINPDIVINSNVIKNIISYLRKNPDVVIATPKILNPDGSLQSLPKKDPKLTYMLSGKLEKFSKYFSKVRQEYTMFKEENFSNIPFNIDFCTGCFMMIRTKVFKKLGGFDNIFFMYLEDADLSRRAKKYGKIMYLPCESATHLWHRDSSKKIKFFLIHLISMFKYLMKWKKDKQEC